jgi:hypothetical protein
VRLSSLLIRSQVCSALNLLQRIQQILDVDYPVAVLVIEVPVALGLRSIPQQVPQLSRGQHAGGIATPDSSHDAGGHRSRSRCPPISGVDARTREMGVASDVRFPFFQSASSETGR